MKKEYSQTPSAVMSRNWREKNKEKIAKYLREWHKKKKEENPDEVKKRVEVTREWRAKNRDHVNAYARNWSKTKESEETKRYRKQQSKEWDKKGIRKEYRARKFGLTLEAYNEYMTKEKCAIEGCSNRPKGLDHDHKTGQVRDALCHQCNVSYGLLGESREKILGLLRYHDKWHSAKQDQEVKQ